MKFINNVKKKCPVCQNEHNYQKLLENNSFGMRDLDTRPPGMMRNMMHLLVEKCPVCGYVSYDMNQPITSSTKSIMESAKYQEILHDDELNFAIKKFMLLGYLLENSDVKKAGITYLRSAWMADDAKKPQIAMKMRSKAIKFLELSLKTEEDENVSLIIVDLYRRIRMFDEAKEEAEYRLNNLGLPKYKKNILLYQIKLCQEHDDLDHTIPGNYDYTLERVDDDE